MPVVIADINSAGLETAAKELRVAGGRVLPVVTGSPKFHPAFC